MQKYVFFVVLAVWCLAAPAFAQFETATVVGTVRDSSGGSSPDAKVTLTNTQTGVSAERSPTLTATSSSSRCASAPTLTAEKSGFSIALVENVQVTVGARQRVDLTMAVGQLSEKVEVSASAVLLQTDSSDRGQIITGEQIRALPLNGREYSALALLSPGVRVSPLAAGGREGSFNVNGLRSTFNNFLIDGVDNNAYGTSNQGFSNQVMQPSPDAVEEFKVVTNNMSAEYGRSAARRSTWPTRAAPTSSAARRGSSRGAPRSMRPASSGRPAASSRPSSAISSAACSAGRSSGIRRSSSPTTRDSSRRAGRRRSRTIPNLAQRQGILSVDVRNPMTGAAVSGRHADSDDVVRPQGAERAAGADECRARRTTIRSCRTLRTRRTRPAAR